MDNAPIDRPRFSDTHRPIGEDELVELLAAYQFLQGQNYRMTSSLSARLGLGVQHLRALLYLEGAPLATPMWVPAKLEHTSGSITPLLDRLENLGYITRHPHPSDRRRLTLQLTESGHTVVDFTRDAYRNAFNDALSSNEIPQAAQILRALGQSLGQSLKPAIDVPIAHDNDA
jgi:DNA-binding MarR family transcriptional regulator